MDASNITTDASEMNLTFFSSTTTALWSLGWVPRTTGNYVGICIFLITLAISFRSLFALKEYMEKRWSETNSQWRYIGRDSTEPIFKRLQTDPDLKIGTLTIDGLEETVQIATKGIRGPATFRFSQDVPRAAMYTVTVAVGYLLMLAVMTMNVGYYLSILGGSFLGELAVGRYVTDEIGHGH